MTVAVWTPALALGHEEIDSQHREMFRRAARLCEAMASGDGTTVARLFDFLGTYVVDHFAAEERLMATAGYPKLEGHRAEHRQLVKELEILRHELQTEGPTNLFVIRVGNRVTEWLREHIYRTDRALGAWLRTGTR